MNTVESSSFHSILVSVSTESNVIVTVMPFIYCIFLMYKINDKNEIRILYGSLMTRFASQAIRFLVKLF